MTPWKSFVCSAALTAAFAPSAFAQKDACSLVTQQQVAAIVGAQVTAAKLHDAVTGQSCSYLTAADGVMNGMISIMIWKFPLSAPEDGLTIQPNDQLSPVSGIGDEAIMDADTHELKFRSGAKWIVVITRGAPCPGDEIGASRAVKDACAVKLNVMLTELAKAAAAAK